MFAAITNNFLRLYHLEKDEHVVEVDFSDAHLSKLAWGGSVAALGSLDGSFYILDLANELQ